MVRNALETYAMKWLLVYRDDEVLAEHWRDCFRGQTNVEVLQSDICHLQVDAVVSPANSFGFMDGGLDYALSERFGWDLQVRVQAAIGARPLKELLVGEAMVLPTLDSTTPWLIVAPSMRVPMQLRQSINPYLAMKASLLAALGHSKLPAIGTVAIPGLGTGCGRMAASTAARQMWAAYREVVLDDWHFPHDFGEAQRSHWQLNPEEIMIWD